MLKMEINGTEVVSPMEIASRFGVSLPAVYVWARRSDFPTPLLTTGGSQRPRHIYSANEIESWVAEHLDAKGGRGKAHLIGRRVLGLATSNPEIYKQIEKLLESTDTE